MRRLVIGHLIQIQAAAYVPLVMIGRLGVLKSLMGSGQIYSVREMDVPASASFPYLWAWDVFITWQHRADVFLDEVNSLGLGG